MNRWRAGLTLEPILRDGRALASMLITRIARLARDTPLAPDDALRRVRDLITRAREQV